MVKPTIYTVGGTVQANEEGIYISRHADTELLQLCQESTFAYVLTPRQMGKSSLMIRTAEQLLDEGIQAVIIDLTQIGTQLTADEWYVDFLDLVASQLLLPTKVKQWWQTNAGSGITLRLTRFFQEVVLAEVSEPIVIFVDEIDTTLSLDFTDDFYAAIRYLYVARSMDSNLRRLSFVLIGVATPADLIRDPKRTPFNIGQRVDLSDFIPEEAMPLAAGLGLPPERAQQVLGWALKWTGGHPYLTQRLCRALVEQSPTAWTETSVGQVVVNTFFGRMSEQDNNLQFVRDMLTKRAPHLLEQEVLTTYHDIYRGKYPVPDEEQNLVKSHLKLSGVVRREGKDLQVRNRIYREVFNRQWIQEHLPENLWQRLKPAMPLIASLLAFSVVTSGLAVYAFAQQRRADEQARVAKEEKQRADKQTQVAYQQRDEARKQRRNADQERRKALAALTEVDKQRQESRRQAALAQNQKQLAEARRQEAENKSQIALAGKLAAQSNLVKSQPSFLITRNALLAIEAMHRLLKFGEPTATADQALRQILSLLAKKPSQISDEKKSNWNISDLRDSEWLIQSPDGKYEVVRDADPEEGSQLFQFIQKSTRKVVKTLKLDKPLNVIALGPEASYFAVSSDQGSTIQIMATDTEQKITDFSIGQRTFGTATFSPDGKYFAVAPNLQTATQEIPFDFPIQVWDLNTSQEILRVNYKPTYLNRLAFSSDSKYLLASDAEGRREVWKVESGSAVITVAAKSNEPRFAINSNGKYFAVAYEDGEIYTYETRTRKEIKRTKTSLQVHALVFRSDGRLLAIGTAKRSGNVTSNSSPLDSIITIWNVTDGRMVSKIKPKDTESYEPQLNVSPDGKYLASRSEIWRIDSGNKILSLSQFLPWALIRNDFSPNSKYIFTSYTWKYISIWETLSGRRVALFHNKNRFNPVDTVASISSNLKFLVQTSWRTTVANILDISENRIITTVKHDGNILDVVFNSDGKHFATAGTDGTARVWEAATGKEVARIAHRGVVTGVKFSLDGKYLTTVTSEGVAQVDLWRPLDMVAEACSRLHRNLTTQEWQQFIGNEPYRKTCPKLPIPKT